MGQRALGWHRGWRAHRAISVVSLPWVTECSGRKRPLRLGDEEQKGQAARVLVDVIQDWGIWVGPGVGVLSGRE